MHKYIIRYGAVKIISYADTAADTVRKLCNRYGWSYRINMYDCDTKGKEWAELYIDKTGGINYAVRCVAKKET